MLSSLQPSDITVQAETAEVTQIQGVNPQRKLFKNIFKCRGSKDEESIPEVPTLATCNTCSKSNPTSAVR